MSRWNSSGSYHQTYTYHNSPWGGYYRLYWTVDYYYDGVRGRFPRTFSRDTDEEGVKRFCKKWNLNFEKGESKNEPMD
jgi:hypothetical protein